MRSALVRAAVRRTYPRKDCQLTGADRLTLSAAESNRSNPFKGITREPTGRSKADRLSAHLTVVPSCRRAEQVHDRLIRVVRRRAEERIRAGTRRRGLHFCLGTVYTIKPSALWKSLRTQAYLVFADLDRVEQACPFRVRIAPRVLGPGQQWCQNRGFAPTDPTTTPRPSVPPPSACTAPHKHTRPSIRVPYALPGRRSPARIRFPDIEALGLQAKSQEFKSRCGYSTFFLYLFSNFSSYILRRLKTWKLLIYKIFSNAWFVIKDAIPFWLVPHHYKLYFENVL